MNQKTIESVVQEKYGDVARSGFSSNQDGIRSIAEAFGYSADELKSIPPEANMGLSCGNPTAFASLRAGETVVDLGCGGGLDVLLAAQRVGPSGRSIGIDMTPDMIELAQRNAEKIDRAECGAIEFHLATIDQIPLADASVDCVISNCVINLAPDKRAVIREIARILKPGGRLAASDIVLKKPLPTEVAGDVMSYVGCFSGAVPREEFRQMLLEAGFDAVELVSTGADLNAYAQADGPAGCCGPLGTDCSEMPTVSLSMPGQKETSVHEGIGDVLKTLDINEFAESDKIYAVKPQAASETKE
jgi:SAM-dependent methyltransferase